MYNGDNIPCSIIQHNSNKSADECGFMTDDGKDNKIDDSNGLYGNLIATHANTKIDNVSTQDGKADMLIKVALESHHDDNDVLADFDDSDAGSYPTLDGGPDMEEEEFIEASKVENDFNNMDTTITETNQANAKRCSLINTSTLGSGRGSSLQKNVRATRLGHTASQLGGKPFAEAIAHGNAKRKMLQEQLKTMRAHKESNPTTTAASQLPEKVIAPDTDTHNHETTINDMEVDKQIANWSSDTHGAQVNKIGAKNIDTQWQTKMDIKMAPLPLLMLNNQNLTPTQVAFQEYFNQKKNKHHTTAKEQPRDKPGKKVTITKPQDNNFTEVKSKGKRSKVVIDTQRPIVSIRMHKIVGSDIKQEKLTDLVKLLELLEGMDETAILLLHNKDASKAVQLVDMHSLQASKIKEFFDYIAEPWCRG